MRETTSSSDTVYYFVADHLGSTSVTLDASGNKIDEMKYYPFGETRSGGAPTDRRFTGQRAETGLGSLYDYGARMYSPVLGRFISADTIVPNPSNPQSLNRFSYVRNNPLKYTDPTGHIEKYDDGGGEPITCQQTNTCVTFWEYVENVILPVAAFFFDGAEYAELINQCRKGECTVGDILLTAIPTGIGKVFKTGAKTINKVDNLADGVDAGHDAARLANAGDDAADLRHEYELTDKHKVGGGNRTKMDLPDDVAEQVLNNGIPHGKQRYGYYDGKLYEFNSTFAAL